MVQETDASGDDAEEKSTIIAPLVAGMILFAIFYCLYKKYCSCRSRVAPTTIVTSTTVLQA
eukprot:1283017-Rhodomonas_salina.2